MSILRRLRDDRWWQAAGGIAVGALALRLYVIAIAKPSCDASGEPARCFQVWGDVLYHYSQAQLIADGHFFKNGVEHLVSGRIVDSAGDPPLFALALGAWSALGFDTLSGQRVLTCLLGATTVLLIAVLARRLGGDLAGWIAGALAALHPLLWINDAMLMSESLYQPAIVVVMLAAYAYTRSPERLRIAALGALIGAASLVRGEAMVLGVFLLVPLVWTTRSLRPAERARQIMLGAVAALAVLAPWVVYNNARFAEPVTLTNSTGAVLIAGSCDSAWSGPTMGYWTDCFTERDLWAPFNEEFPAATAQGADRIVYDESVLDAFSRKHALDYIGENLPRYPLVMLARAGRTLELFRVGDTLHWTATLEGRWRLPSQAGLAMYYLLAAPAAAGVWLMRRDGQRLVPLLAMWPTVLTATMLTFGLTRYRVPIDIAMILLAAVSLEIWGEKLLRRARQARAPGEQPSMATTTLAPNTGAESLT